MIVTMQNPSRAFSHMMPTSTIGGRYFHPHCIDGETEAWDHAKCHKPVGALIRAPPHHLSKVPVSWGSGGHWAPGASIPLVSTYECGN